MDIAFVLDSAGTVHAERWHFMADFIESVISRLDIGPDRTRIAVVYYSTTAMMAFPFDRYYVRQVKINTYLASVCDGISSTTVPFCFIS